MCLKTGNLKSKKIFCICQQPNWIHHISRKPPPPPPSPPDPTWFTMFSYTQGRVHILRNKKILNWI